MVQSGPVIVTGESKRARILARALRRHVPALAVPTVRILDRLRSVRTLRTFNIAQYDSVVFTSGNAIQYFQKLLWHLKIPIRAVPHVCAVGARTKRLAKEAGFKVYFTPAVSDAVSLARKLPKVSGTRILFPCSKAAGREIDRILTRRGANVTRLVLYEPKAISVSRSHLERLFARQPRALVITSPSGIPGFVRHMQQGILRRARKTAVLCMGETTRAAARKSGFTRTIVPSRATQEDLIKTILTL